MNADHRGEDVADRGDDAVGAAFAAYRAEASGAFPPPPVDELIMRGPASLRRRRLASLAAVAGAATVVTAGGFAVAQTLGSQPKEPEPAGPPTAVQGNGSHSGEGDTELGEALTPGPAQTPADDADTPTTGAVAQLTIVIADLPGTDCAGGGFEVDADGRLPEESGWTLVQAVGGDLTGDETPETTVALACEEATAVAAFAVEDDRLEQIAWVWQPDESQELSAIESVEAGVITLQGLDGASETWTARYEWDGEAFARIDEAPTTEPSSPESSETPESGATQTTSATPTGEADS